jgi:DNA-binding NarL/FixJ family response regulator
MPTETLESPPSEVCPSSTKNRAKIAVDGLLLKFTPREFEIFHMLSGTRSNKEMAAVLGIATNTVGRHMITIYAKCGVTSRVEFWVKFGFKPENR